MKKPEEMKVAELRAALKTQGLQRMVEKKIFYNVYSIQALITTPKIQQPKNKVPPLKKINQKNQRHQRKR
jgi:hypothetical protein